MNEHILKFDIAVNDALFVKVEYGLDELVADVPDCLHGERVIVFDVLQKRLLSSVLYYQAHFGESLNTLVQLNHALVVQVLHDVDLFLGVLELVRVLVHLELLVHFYRYQIRHLPV